MEHEGYRPHRGTDDERHGDGQDHQQLGIERDVRPGTAMPPTVLVTQLDNGALVLQGRPDGPRGYLTPADALPLKRELAAAFQRIELTTAGDNQGEAP
ncbi:MAG: hypothetical protein LC808_04055 [Actinobacteria bacterium]|nr:hypothetical protein [Actinomycetota bacterium]